MSTTHYPRTCWIIPARPYAARKRACEEVVARLETEVGLPATIVRPTYARLAYFRIAAGLEEGAHEGTNWSDGDCYKWLEAMAHVYGVTRDPELDRQMDEVIGWIAGAQEPDGYLNTQITLDPSKRRWQNVQDHELYNVGHCFSAAAEHYEATGKRSLLEVAVKLADYLCGVFLPTPRVLANFGFNPSQIVGLVDLYR